MFSKKHIPTIVFLTVILFFDCVGGTILYVGAYQYRDFVLNSSFGYIMCFVYWFLSSSNIEYEIPGWVMVLQLIAACLFVRSAPIFNTVNFNAWFASVGLFALLLFCVKKPKEESNN